MPDIDNVLRRQVDNLQQSVSTLDVKVGAVGQQVDRVNTAQIETRNQLQQLHDEFQHFVQQAERTANLQRAETKLGALRDQLEHEFGHHKVVRRTATGILQGFDTGLVSEETVRNISEELMIQSPRYWLAPALIALAAWASDEQELCTKAVTEAFRRSPERTSLLFSLVLRRQGRVDVSVRWLAHYLSAQVPGELGRDFAVILEAISQGAFGPAGLELVEGTLAEWRAELLSSQEVQDRQVQLWRGEVAAHAVPAQQEFPQLAVLSPQWPQLEAALAQARAHGPLRDKYQAMMAEEPTPSTRIEDAVDDILDRLVSEYDPEELPLKRELDHNQAIVDSMGDLAAAAVVVQGSVGLETTLDYLTIQTTSALRPADIGVSRATQRLAVAACKDWFATAHDQFTLGYRSALPSEVSVQFTEQNTPGGVTYRLPTWTGSFTRPMPELEHSLGDHWDRHGRQIVDALAFNWTKAVLPPAFTALAILLVFAGANIGVAFLLALLVGGVWGFVIYLRAQGSLKAQEAARRAIADFKAQSLAQLRQAGAELTDWQSRFRAADAQEEPVRRMIADLSSAGQMSTRFDGRTVRDVRGLA